LDSQVKYRKAILIVWENWRGEDCGTNSAIKTDNVFSALEAVEKVQIVYFGYSCTAKIRPFTNCTVSSSSFTLGSSQNEVVVNRFILFNAGLGYGFPIYSLHER